MDRTEFIKMLADGVSDFVVNKDKVIILYPEINTEVVYRFFSDGTLRDTFVRKMSDMTESAI